MSTRIVRIRGRAVPVAGDDVDTDQIMPSRFLRRLTFAGLEDHIFEDLRSRNEHPLDNPRYAGATIMIVERNFGCGSSREHAPQGLLRSGIKAIIGESFGEIFAGNCVSIGLVSVTAARDDRLWLSDLCRTEPNAIVELDLQAKLICASGRTMPCDIPEGRRLQFLNGDWDPLRLLLASPTALDAMDSIRPRVRPRMPRDP